MKTPLILIASLLAASPVRAQSPPQRTFSTDRTTALYLAVIREVPPIAADRHVILDPRNSASFFGGAHPVDVWEGHLAGTSESAAVRGLSHHLDGLTYCTEAPGRSCLTSASAAHVTFSSPVFGDSTAMVEATFAIRTSDERTSFDIQTWRYSFVLTASGPVLGTREMVGRGHGRIGGT